MSVPKRRKFTLSERNFIILRAQGLCEYCQTPYDFSPDTFEIEHILPIAHGGNNELGNLAFSCGGCNGRKSYKTEALDALTQTTNTIFNPRTETWDEHFFWDEGFKKVVGGTPTGRATVELLQLNRQGLVNLRSALFSFGVHPKSK